MTTKNGLTNIVMKAYSKGSLSFTNHANIHSLSVLCLSGRIQFSIWIKYMTRSKVITSFQSLIFVHTRVRHPSDTKQQISLFLMSYIPRIVRQPQTFEVITQDLAPLHLEPLISRKLSRISKQLQLMVRSKFE